MSKTKATKKKKPKIISSYHILHNEQGLKEEEFYEEEISYDIDFNENIHVSEDEYIDLIHSIRNNILNNIEEEKDIFIRAYIPTKENIDEYIPVIMTQGQLLTLLILAEPFHRYEVMFTDEFIFTVKDVSGINNYFDKIIKYFLFEHNININEVLMHTISELSIVSAAILGSYAVTINLFDICKLVNENKEFSDILHFNLRNVKKKLDFKESMNLINKKFEKLLSILKREDTCYRLLLNSKAGINDRQLKDTIFKIDYKPDEKGYIITEPADTSYIIGNDIISYYIDCVGGRKALCINKKNTKTSGYLTRKLSLLSIDNYIDEDVEDCGSKRYIELFIDSQKTLNRYIYRNYVIKKGKKVTIKTINPETDQHLIGKTILLRSPITCACKHGRICKTCYGDFARYNYEKNVGLIATLILTNQNTQLQLSAKHNLQANVNEIDWGEDFLKYFSVNKEQIYLSTDIAVEYLPETDKENLNTGIYIYGSEKLTEILQDFE